MYACLVVDTLHVYHMLECIYMHFGVFGSISQGEFGLDFPCDIMEEGIWLLDIGFPLVHIIAIIRKGHKGSTSVLLSLEGLD